MEGEGSSRWFDETLEWALDGWYRDLLQKREDRNAMIAICCFVIANGVLSILLGARPIDVANGAFLLVYGVFGVLELATRWADGSYEGACGSTWGVSAPAMSLTSAAAVDALLAQAIWDGWYVASIVLVLLGVAALVICTRGEM